MTRFFALPLLALALPAQAELPPCVTDDLMREAPLVMQIANPMVSMLSDNTCQFSGVVQAVHRGIAAEGDWATVTFDCITDPNDVEIGAIVYSDPLAVGLAAVVEAHVDEDGHIAANGTGLIALDAPTQAIAWGPYCD